MLRVPSVHMTVERFNYIVKRSRFIAASLKDAYIYRQGGLVLEKDGQQKSAWPLKLE